MHQEEWMKLISRSLMSEEEKAAVYRELQGRMSEVINAATATNPAQPAVAQLVLGLLTRLTANSDVRAADLWATLGATGRVAVVAAATTSAQPAVAQLALGLLGHLTANSDVRAVELWATLGVLGRAAVIAAATDPAQPAVAERALNLLSTLSMCSDDITVELWDTLGAPGRAAVVAAATNPAQPAVAERALFLLSTLSMCSDDITVELWVTLGAPGRAAVVAAVTSPAQPRVARQALNLLNILSMCSEDITVELWATCGAAVAAAATNPAQPVVAERALFLLANLATNSDIRAAQLWTTLGAAGRAAVVAAATNPAQPAVAELALGLLGHLTAHSDVRAADLWDTFGDAGRAAVVATATNPAQPTVARLAFVLLLSLAASSSVRAAELWDTLGAAGRAAVLTAVTDPAQPAVAEQALVLLRKLTDNPKRSKRNLTTYFNVIKAELWATLGAAEREGLIIAATTAGEPRVASNAIRLLQLLNVNPHINAAIWPLLQPRLAQLWAVTQRSAVGQRATDFLFEQIRGDAQRTRQAFDALNAAIPAVSVRHTIDTLRQWGHKVSSHEPNRLALLTGIVQTNTSPQKMAVCMAAVMSGISLRQRPPEDREALRDQLLAMPMAEGIDPTPYRQHMGLVFDAATSNTSAVLASPVLSESEKLQRLEILYISSEVMTGQATQEESSKVRLMPNTSRDFKVKAIGLILNHGQASSIQFKETLAWLKGEFKTNTYTVFTNPATLGDIGDEAIYALAEQRQQYLALYQNFRLHMADDFIQAEIAAIRQQVLTKEIPEDFAATLIFQLEQFLSTAGTDTAVKDDRQFDRKSESK